MLVLRQLSSLGSVSAEIITRLELTRELVRIAYTILKEERRAQVTLAKILSGTRFKYYLNGVLVPTRCPNKFGRGECNQCDSFDHLLRCYGLRKKFKKGADSVKFLILMARRAIPPLNKRTRPMYIHP